MRAASTDGGFRALQQCMANSPSLMTGIHVEANDRALLSTAEGNDLPAENGDFKGFSVGHCPQIAFRRKGGAPALLLLLRVKLVGVAAIARRWSANRAGASTG